MMEKRWRRSELTSTGLQSEAGLQNEEAELQSEAGLKGEFIENVESREERLSERLCAEREGAGNSSKFCIAIKSICLSSKAFW